MTPVHPVKRTHLLLCGVTLLVLGTALLWPRAASAQEAPAGIGLDAAAAPPAGTVPQTSPEARLTEEQAIQVAAANSDIGALTLKHPELERRATYSPLWRIWEVSWTDPVTSRQLADVRVDDIDGKILSADVKSTAWLDTLPSLDESTVKEIAGSQPKVKDEIRGKPDVDVHANLGDDGVWTVSFYSGSEEIARVLVNDPAGTVKEIMVGPQVAWQMARGYPGAFGRIINEPYVWLPLCLLFLLPFADIRDPWRLLHLDLLVLLSFTVSHYFFNQGEIFRSAPLAYPPLVYLFLRLGWLAVKRSRPQPPAAVGGWGPAAPDAALMSTRNHRPRQRLPHLNFSPRVLLIGLALLIVFRITINVADSNVVDVGYSGVIGAHRILEDRTPYGNMPSDDQNGDTYGPMNYLVYIPFEKVLPWSGSWDDLPAAHAAAIFFDLAAIAGLFFAGRALMRDRRQGNILGLMLAYGWAAYPYTTFVLNCNVNDSIVAAFLVWGFVFLKRLPLAGFMLGLGSMIKFFPAILGPLWASFPNAFRGWGRRALFVLAFAVAAGLTLPVIFLGGGTFGNFLDRSIRWQLGRNSPFSIWGQYPDRLAAVQHVGQYVLVALAAAAYFWPPKKTLANVAAGSAALIVGFQIFLTHWFYLYIPWFFPLALIALLMSAGGSEDGGVATIA